MNPFIKRSQINMGFPALDQPYYGYEEGGPGEWQEFTEGDVVEIIGGSSYGGAGSGDIKDWIRAESRLYSKNGRKLDSRKIGNNTILYRQNGGDIAVRYHYTDIIIYHSNDTITINTGGWWTVTTLQRINHISPASIGTAYKSQRHPYEIQRGSRVFHTKYGMYPYKDMTVIDTEGTPLDMIKIPQALDRAGQHATILYKDEGRSRGRWDEVFKVQFEDGEVGFYESRNLKMVQPGEQHVQELNPAPEITGEEGIVLASRNPFKRAQELKNDIHSDETETPSDSESSTGHNLEFVDRTDDKKNTRPTHHQGPMKSATLPNPFKRAQSDLHKFNVGDSVVFQDVRYDNEERSGVIIYAGSYADDDEPMYTIRTDDGTTVFVREHYIRVNEPNLSKYTQEEATPSADDIENWYKNSVLKNPFCANKIAQTDHETAETGHIGNGAPVEKPTGGGRSPGNLDNPTPNNPFAHETSQNSKGEQVA